MVQDSGCRLASPRLVTTRSLSPLAVKCLSTTLVCCGAERDFVSFALKRFRSAAIIFENLCTFPSASHTTGKKREEPRNENKLLISPEHVQPVQGDISTNIPGKGGTRETVPHLK